MLRLASEPLLRRKRKSLILVLLLFAAALGAAFYSGKNHSEAADIGCVAALQERDGDGGIWKLGLTENPYGRNLYEQNLFLRMRAEQFIEQYIAPLMEQMTTEQTTEGTASAEEGGDEEAQEGACGELYAECLTAEGIMRAALAMVEEETLELMASPAGTSLGGYTKVYAGETPLLITEEDMAVLLRIVEAEATSEDVKGRMLVANVVLNRVLSEKFPDSVTEVVFQNNGRVYQFSPLKDGRYWTVSISEKTREAVSRVLAGEDYSQGALYFAARKLANPKNMEWFDSTLTKLFQYGVHEFFTD